MIFVYVANIIVKGPNVHYINLLLFCVSLAVGIIPEALSVVMTFALARGAAKLAENKVVVKRLSAIEDLRSIEILCTDKTGTLTQNEQKVMDIYSQDKQEIALLTTLASAMNDQQLQTIKGGFNNPLWKILTDEQKKSYS